MIKPVDLDNWPTCPFQEKDGNFLTRCKLDDRYEWEPCDEKAPQECPLRKACVIVMDQEHLEDLR